MYDAIDGGTWCYLASRLGRSAVSYDAMRELPRGKGRQHVYVMQGEPRGTGLGKGRAMPLTAPRPIIDYRLRIDPAIPSRSCLSRDAGNEHCPCSVASAVAPYADAADEDCVSAVSPGRGTMFDAPASDSVPASIIASGGGFGVVAIEADRPCITLVPELPRLCDGAP